MISFSITVDESAAPRLSLAFMFCGASSFVFPLALLYTAVSYGVFRGKARSNAEHGWPVRDGEFSTREDAS